MTTIPIEQNILYEDNHLLVYNKRPSQITQGDKTGDIPLPELLMAFLKKRDHKPGNVFMGVVHRLDRPVSGVVVFAKTSKALSRMNELVRSGGLQKTYWAVVRGTPPMEEAHLVHWLHRNEEKNKSYVSDRETPGSKKAELIYRRIGISENYSLLEIELLTGRHHQIRAQLARIGCPVKGDLKYGYDRSNPDGSIHLHARAVEFIHPVKKEPLRIIADPPRDTLWDFFLNNLS